MTQLHTISRNNTTVTPVGQSVAVQLHRTVIAWVHPDRVDLDTGGYLTVTTITRMNQVANQMGLGFSVSRKGGEFTARLRDGTVLVSKNGRTLSIPRATQALDLSRDYGIADTRSAEDHKPL